MNQELKILIGMHRNVNRIDRQTLKIVSEYGLTLSQFSVLEALYSKGDMTVGMVRDSILSSMGTISVIVSNLIKMNYIKRIYDEKDRRMCILSLTQEGRDIIEKVLPKNIAMIQGCMQVLDKEEQEQLLYLLKKLGGRI